MFNLLTIQSTARSVIAAAELDSVAYFEDADVIAEDGYQRDTVEDRLNTRGFAVTVELPVGGRVIDRAPNVTHAHVVFAVNVVVNPKVNADNEDRDILEIVDVVCSAMLAHGSDATDRFEHDDDAFSLLVDDEGKLMYMILFRAHTVLAETVNL